MRAAEAIFLIVLLAALLLAALVWLGSRVGRRLGAWRDTRREWQAVERSDGEQVCVYAQRPGQEPLLIGAASFAALDFEIKLYELRNEAHDRVLALNQGEGKW